MQENNKRMTACRVGRESVYIKDSCPFYGELDESLGASARANPIDVLERVSVDLLNNQLKQYIDVI